MTLARAVAQSFAIAAITWSNVATRSTRIAGRPAGMPRRLSPVAPVGERAAGGA